ncbi:biotin/lipoyl-binding protein [Sphaerotilus sp.]|uniref:biotin/lipoyl-binding protein n=1 Tax=Sphaerotilus sp. TaxID=2093942 RepID=UPI002ACD4306|nr:biotin/lipoyl-binding protein [Sphaerotilus sp.]MDZ7854883.1 biotin/lipoyl-binding protein [Sphaerotilus sp.]
MDDAPLLSARWFRMAGLRPLLDPQATVQRMAVRGAVWQVLTRPDGSRSVRLNASAWATVGRCDGQHTLQRLWDITLAELRDDTPTQDELIGLLARLHQSGLLRFDRVPDFDEAPSATSVHDHLATDGPRQSLLAWRFPLGCPDVWLARLARRLRWLFTPVALLLWLSGMVAVLFAAWPQAEALSAQLREGLGTPRWLAWAWLVYPVMKVLHEAAHGLAIRHWGAQVPQWGVTLLMGTPVPYVDAGAAVALPSRWQRAAVAAAGIVVELTLVALGLGVALAVQPGALRDLALVVVAIGGLSSLLVNANPLLRFDGYHLLCDLADLPNLAPRSSAHWLHAMRTRVLRVPGESPVVPLPGEAPWLWGYAPAALVMRWSVALGVLLWLESVQPLLAVLAALVLGWTLVGQPLRAFVRWLGGGALEAAERRRVAWSVAALALLVGGPLVALPMPDAALAQGVLWPPEDALVRNPTAGFVAEVLVADGQAVPSGQPLLRLESPALQAERERLAGRIEVLQAERFQALRLDKAQLAAVDHALQAAQAELDRTDGQLAGLLVRAQVAGRVHLTGMADLPGRWLARGALLGHVETDAPGRVRVVVAQGDAALVTAHRGPVEVWLLGTHSPAQRGALLGTPSGGGAPLPSAALGERHGGGIATDPADPQGLRPAQPVLQADVQLEHAIGERIGARAWVRFERPRTPLAWQAVRALQQQLLQHLGAAP